MYPRDCNRSTSIDIEYKICNIKTIAIHIASFSYVSKTNRNQMHQSQTNKLTLMIRIWRWAIREKVQRWITSRRHERKRRQRGGRRLVRCSRRQVHQRMAGECCIDSHTAHAMDCTTHCLLSTPRTWLVALYLHRAFFVCTTLFNGNTYSLSAPRMFFICTAHSSSAPHSISNDGTAL